MCEWLKSKMKKNTRLINLLKCFLIHFPSILYYYLKKKKNKSILNTLHLCLCLITISWVRSAARWYGTSWRSRTGASWWSWSVDWKFENCFLDEIDTMARFWLKICLKIFFCFFLFHLALYLNSKKKSKRTRLLDLCFNAECVWLCRYEKSIRFNTTELIKFSL